jgi:hypothetical protein
MIPLSRVRFTATTPTGPSQSQHDRGHSSPTTTQLHRDRSQPPCRQLTTFGINDANRGVFLRDIKCGIVRQAGFASIAESKDWSQHDQSGKPPPATRGPPPVITQWSRLDVSSYRFALAGIASFRPPRHLPPQKLFGLLGESSSRTRSAVWHCFMGSLT